MGYAERANGKCKTVIVDFDDASDGNDGLDTLRRLKDRDPGFRVTLFAIPTRLSDGLLARYAAERDWIGLGVHGWRHSRHECLSWTSEETAEKLGLALKVYPDFHKVFKAPNWQMCDEVYKGLAAAGFGVADHISNVAITPVGTPHYVYNFKSRDDHRIKLHGHIQPFNGTGLEEAYEVWSAPPIGSEYRFIRDTLAPSKGV